MDTSTISIIIAIIGCVVGISGWVSRRDSRTESDAEWKGGVNAKLDMILRASNGNTAKIEDHEHRITALENR